MSNYDCTAEVKVHQDRVRVNLELFSRLLLARGPRHDVSKLTEPEKTLFDIWRPKLKTIPFGTDEYKSALEGMGESLKLHYANNAHHPEHYPNGIEGMTLIDIIEMYCDWMAASDEKGTPLSDSWEYLFKRFSISPQLQAIFANTLYEVPVWHAPKS